MTKSPLRRVTFESVRKAALSLPSVEEGTAWGFPVFKLAKPHFSFSARISIQLRCESVHREEKCSDQ